MIENRTQGAALASARLEAWSERTRDAAAWLGQATVSAVADVRRWAQGDSDPAPRAIAQEDDDLDAQLRELETELGSAHLPDDVERKFLELEARERAQRIERNRH